MSELNGSAPAPDSLEAQALAELEKEGHVIEGKEPVAPEPKDEPKKEEPAAPQKEEPKAEIPPKEEKPNRTPKMVEAWKLHTAESQKDAALKQVADLTAKMDELSKQKTPVTQVQQDDIAAEIKKITEGKEGVDVDLLTKFAETILAKTSKSQPSSELQDTVKKLQEERQLEKELNDFSAEFEKDVLPLVADKQLSGDALSQLKESLKSYAFSDVYAKVPLKEIFAIKQSELVTIPKKASEGKAPKVRATDVVDIDNISEEDFSKLPPEKVEEFMKKKSGGGWTR